MPAVRYTPASDTSVLGNRVWVARNQPYGGIITYSLPQTIAGGVEISVKDASGREVQALRGPGAAGLNRAVWNLAESSSCPPVTDSAEAGQGPGARAGRSRGRWHLGARHPGRVHRPARRGRTDTCSNH